MIRSVLTKLAGLLLSIPVFGGVITTQTFDFSDDRSGVVNATVTVTVLDNYHGDPTKQDWVYTINNLSFTSTYPNGPILGLNLFSTIDGAFQNLTYKHVSDVTGVSVTGNNPLLMGDISPGFCWQCDLLGGGWYLPDSSGLGLLPGQSATVDFSWLKVPGAVTTGVAADAFVSVQNNHYTRFGEASGGSTLVPRTTLAPEPATAGVAAFALCMFGSLRWWRQKRLRTHARRAA